MSQTDSGNSWVTINQSYSAKVSPQAEKHLQISKFEFLSLKICAVAWLIDQSDSKTAYRLSVHTTLNWWNGFKRAQPSFGDVLMRLNIQVQANNNGSCLDSWALGFSLFTHIKLRIYQGKIYVLYPLKMLNTGSYSTVNGWVQMLQDICSDIRQSSRSVGCGSDKSFSLAPLSKCKGCRMWNMCIWHTVYEWKTWCTAPTMSIMWWLW